MDDIDSGITTVMTFIRNIKKEFVFADEGTQQFLRDELDALVEMRVKRINAYSRFVAEKPKRKRKVKTK
jgi:hypothetical protein